ncbi:MAG: pyridoxamine 5'-phosphate oxidase family protein [Planctomycetes bacterium]|nr:pyridoxamine 5'-phosphate oxidase family protein [Planctomycetota bacterium]MBI3835343.1 pyridoxamine 5'-phosphate oxidase family protein [Planctomycetota bacterium]
MGNEYVQNVSATGDGQSTGAFDPTPRTTVRRLAVRGKYDRETVYKILDEALICHVGFVDEGHPFVIPTIHARLGDTLYFHGSNASRLLKRLCDGTQVCITATLLDGLVLARSGFHHSMNYRSVVVLGQGSEVVDRDAKLAALEAVSEHVIPKRWDYVRPVNENELNATRVAAVAISEASAKIRTGPPKDDDEDYVLPVWAGVIPMALAPGTPIPDPRLIDGIAIPGHVLNFKTTSPQISQKGAD